MAVRCLALHQLHICLLCQVLSSHARQAVAEEPFTSSIQTMVKVFCMNCVVMIVVQQVIRVVNLHGYM
jgi:hypothetical protein